MFTAIKAFFKAIIDAKQNKVNEDVERYLKTGEIPGYWY